jgi:Anti-sigma-K factor rskA
MEPIELPEDIESLLAGYALGNLSPEENAHLKRLLDEYPELAAELEDLQATLSLLPLTLPEVEPLPAHLEAQILDEAQTDLELSHVVRPARAKRIAIPKVWVIGLSSAAAFVISLLGLQTYDLQEKLTVTQKENQQLQQALTVAKSQLKQSTQTRQQLSRYQQAVSLLQQPDNRFIALRASQPKLTSTGSLVIAPRSSTALLALQQVEPLPPGKVYRMWAIVNGRKISCADFKPNAKGEVLVQIPLAAWGEATEIVVTLEPEQSLPQPVGEMVITGG